MSTVVYYNGVLGTDRAVSSDGIMLLGTSKGYIIPHEHGQLMMAVAGRAISAARLVAWVMDDMDRERFPKLSENDPTGLMTVHSHTPGLVKLYETAPWPIEFEGPLFAMGSGEKFALGAAHTAIACRKDRFEVVRLAMEAAARYDVHTSTAYDIQWFKELKIET